MRFVTARGAGVPVRRGGHWWLVIGVLGGSAHAAEFNYGIEYAAERSSNIRRAPVIEEEETINSILLSARYRELLPTFRAEIAMSGERRDYRRGTFQDETLFLLDGTAVWVPIPQFSWTVADSYRNVPVSRALPDTPANREDTNMFLTGPGVEWRITPADHLLTEARYGRFDAERSDIDNDRHSLALRWRHRHSSLSENSLNYEYLRVDFDNDVTNTNYRRQDLFYRGRFRPSRNELTVDLGYTNIDRERLAEASGSLFRLTAARAVTSARQMGATVSAQYSDTAMDLSPSGITTTPTPGGAAAATPETLTGDIFYTKRAEIFTTSTAVPLPWSVNVYASEQDYEQGLSDVEESGGRLSVSYLRTSNVSFNAYSSYAQLEYPLINRTDRDTVSGLGISYRLSRNLLLSLEGQRAERRSSDPLQSFVDDRAFLRLAYNVTRRWN